MMATRVLERVFSEERLGVPLINVNLPDTTLEPNPETVPIVECRCDMHSFPLAYAKRENGFDYVGRYSQRQFEPENDVGICFGGQISWTWLTRDLNAR
jgi:broad specificity polyphosphatase/5'/3'-nucleotidase SurE